MFNPHANLKANIFPIEFWQVINSFTQIFSFCVLFSARITGSIVLGPYINLFTVFNLSCSLRRVFCVLRHERTCFSISSIGSDWFRLGNKLNCTIFRYVWLVNYERLFETSAKPLKNHFIGESGIFLLVQHWNECLINNLMRFEFLRNAIVLISVLIFLNELCRICFKLVDLSENRITNMREVKFVYFILGIIPHPENRIGFFIFWLNRNWILAFELMWCHCIGWIIQY